MAVTSGFYNSNQGDRKYNAEQMSSIFDGIIRDGVYATIGDVFIVSAVSGLNLTVGTGRAWFNHSWILNDALYPITGTTASAMLGRIDAVVIDVNGEDAVRESTIKYIEGTASGSPQPPTMINSGKHHQYPLAYITRPAGSTSISASQIQNTVGTTICPFVMCPLETVDMSTLLQQWRGEFDDWFDGLYVTLDSQVATRLAGQTAALKAHTTGNLCAVAAKVVTVPASAWQSDTSTGSVRYLARITDSDIDEDRAVLLQIEDSKALEYADIASLRPQSGYIELARLLPPLVSIQFNMFIMEYRYVAY